jgi:hypothetical protein
MGNEIEGLEAQSVLELIVGTIPETGAWVMGVSEEVLMEENNF